ncbi:MAG: thioredoxin-dependent thiol peroxidase [Chlamydiales bacterium]
MLNIGDQAPEFSLPDAEGKEHRLSDFSGQWIVLYFYPKDDTPGCTTEACDFSRMYPNFKEREAVIIGISPDSSQKHQSFIQKHELKIILLSDESKSSLKDYGAWGIKKNYGKEYEGVIRSTFLIDPRGQIVYRWQNVKVNGHSQAVLDRLHQLQSKAASTS